MMEKRMEYMIHEALECGGGITQDKGHDQNLIVALMSCKGILGNVFLFHTYLLVAQIKIKFSKQLGATQFIQEVINENNGKFVFNGKFVEGTEVRTHSPITFFLEDHDHRRRVGDHFRADNTCIKNFLDHFLNFIFLGKGVTIEKEIGRKDSRYKGDGMIMNTTRRRESLGSGKYHLMFKKDGLEVLQHRGCLCFLYGMELGNNTIMTFLQKIYHVIGTNDLR
jgi:hypothetical protein